MKCKSIYYLGFGRIKLECEKEEDHEGMHSCDEFEWNDLIALIFG